MRRLIRQLIALFQPLLPSLPPFWPSGWVGLAVMVASTGQLIGSGC